MKHLTSVLEERAAWVTLIERDSPSLVVGAAVGHPRLEAVVGHPEQEAVFGRPWEGEEVAVKHLTSVLEERAAWVTLIEQDSPSLGLGAAVGHPGVWVVEHCHQRGDHLLS